MKALYFILFALFCFQLMLAAEAPQVVLFPDHHMILEATGKVILKADKAVFSYSVTGYGSSLRAAVEQARTKVAEIASALNKLGIGNENLATGSFTSGKYTRSLLLSDKKDYTASLTTSVTLTDMTKVDNAVLILADKKVDYISNISYSMSNQAQARQQAREMALNRINEQRETICSKLGVEVTDVILIDEAPFEPLPWNPNSGYYYSGLSNTVTKDKPYSFEAYEDAPEPMVEGGMYAPDLTVETQVRVIYKIGLKQTK